MATKKKVSKKEEAPVEKTKTAKVAKEEKTEGNPAKAAYEAAKAESGAAWKEVQAYMKENKLKPGQKVEDIKDKKIAAGYKELKKKHKALKVVTEEAEAEMKKNRPASAPRGKYIGQYTGDETPAEKKKLRAKWRAEAKREAKGETAVSKPKKEKKVEKEEKTPKSEKVEKSSKKDKKAKKGKIKPTEEDED